MRKGIFIVLSALIVFSYSFTPSYAAVVSSASTPLPANEPDPDKIRDAVNEFRSLPKKEMKSRLKQVKKALKDFKKERKKGNDPSTDTLLLVIIALLVPPLAVYIHQGETNNKFWITTVLFVVGIICAFLFSWLIMLASIVYALIVILGNE